MGIKCSLLGHRFTATDTAEQREEQGSEVVITRKEVETCARCGESRVVSENKEVRSLASETEAAAGAEPPTAGAPAPDIDAVEADAELLDDAGGTRGSDAGGVSEADAATVEAGMEGSAADGPEDVTAAEDDAVILDDDEPERAPGAWPGDEGEAEAAGEDEVAVGPAVEEEWPDEYGYTEGSGAGAEAVSWPEEDGTDSEEWAASEGLTEGIDSAELESAGSTVTVPDGEFVCPECSFTALVEESSLRAGDFCPECRRGALEHRPEAETRKE